MRSKEGKKKKENNKKIVGIIGNTIGYSILVAVMSIFLIIFVFIIFFGGVLLYEPNRIISTIEIIIISIGFIFLIYLCKKNIWDDKF